MDIKYQIFILKCQKGQKNYIFKQLNFVPDKFTSVKLKEDIWELWEFLMEEATIAI